MPACFSILICSLSTQDKDFLTWTLVGIADNFSVEVLGTHVPFEVFAVWEFDESEIGLPLDFQIYMTNTATKEIHESPVFTAKVDGTRTNIRLKGFKLPPNEGRYLLSSRVRINNKEPWAESIAYWPFTVEKSLGHS
jgi:hypothetical protein